MKQFKRRLGGFVLAAIFSLNLFLSTEYMTLKAEDLSNINNNQIAITKDTVVVLESNAERFSDIQYWMKDPKGNITKYDLFVNDSSKIVEKEFELGEQKSDDRAECINIRGNRRIGICSDGIYSFELQSTDAAGNVSEKSKVTQIERDTVRPGEPKASIDICNNNICITITSSELNTAIYANGNYLGANTTNSTTVVAKYNFVEDTTYNFKVDIRDRAGNVSDSVDLEIHTPSFGIGGGGNYGEDNKFKELYEGKLFPLKGRINPNGEFIIEEFTPPAPFITSTETKQNGDVFVYGLAPFSGYEISIDAEIMKESRSIGEASSLCGVPKYRLAKSYEELCVADKMNITHQEYLSFIHNVFDKCNSDHKYYIPYRFISCVNSKNKISRVNLKTKLNFDHVEILLYKKVNDNFEYITKNRNCNNKTAPCFDENNRYWHGRDDGRWYMNFDKNILKPGDQVSSKLRFFSDFSIKIGENEYKGTNASFGHESDFGNVEVVSEAVTPIYDIIRSPFLKGQWDFKPVITQYPCGSYSHSSTGAYDIDADSKEELYGILVPIVSTTSGIAKIKNHETGYGVHVIIENPKYKIIYAHLHKNSLALFKKGSKEILPGQIIGYEGDTGNSDGSHLHYELYINSGYGTYRKSTCSEARQLIGPSLFKF